MRNLKRALSLALASVMVMGLMVVGTGASYADVSSEQNQEAIEVLQAVGVMTGDENGKFNPDAKVTRNEMAVIMSNMLDYKVSNYAGTAPFTDVPAWAEPYVAACWTHGIISGYDAKTFGGSDSVTAAQAALMMLKALGYFQYQSDFGDSWELSTIRKANQIDLYSDVKAAALEAMTRNDVAQLALNTLEATVVDASGEPNKVITPDGTTVLVGAVEYFELEKSGNQYTTIFEGNNDNGKYTVQLGEELYDGDLEKRDSTDEFNRPASVWSYQSREIGKYADAAKYTYTAAVSNKTLANDIGKTALDNYSWSVSVDGNYQTAAKPDKNASGDWYQTGKGVLTQVFVDNKTESVDVVLVNSYVAEITKVVEDDGEYTLTLKPYAPNGGSNPAAGDRTFETDVVGFEKEDIVVYTAAQSEIQSVAKAEIVSGDVTSVKIGKNASLDGTQYDYSKMIAKNLDDNTATDPSLNDGYEFYLDTYGYMIAFKGVETIDDYLFVTKALPSVTGVDAKVVLADGTEKTIAVDEVEGNGASAKAEDAVIGTYGADGAVATNNIYSYTEDDGVYTLTALKSGTGDGQYKAILTLGTSNNEYNDTTPANSKVYYTIERDIAKMVGKAAVGSTAPSDVRLTTDTVFVDVKDNVIYNGYTEVVDYEHANAAVVFDKNGKAEIIFVTNCSVSGVDADYFFVKDGKPVITKDGSTKYYTYDAFIDGEAVKVTTKGMLSEADASGVLPKNSLYKITKQNADNEVTAVDLVATWDETSIFTSNYATLADGYTLGLHNASSDLADGQTNDTFRYDDETVFVVIEPKNKKGTVVDADKVYLGTDADIETEDDVTAVYVIDADDKTDATPYATLVYVIKQANIGGTTTPETPDYTGVFVDISDPTDVTVTYNGDAAPELETILAAVEAEIVKAGYTVNEITESSTPGSYVFSATKGKITRNYTYDSTTAPTPVFAVSKVTTDNEYVNIQSFSDYVASSGKLKVVFTKKDGGTFDGTYTSSTLSGGLTSSSVTPTKSTDNKTLTLEFTLGTLSADITTDVKVTLG
ncbi:Hexagonal wall protein [uncultured Flavonifractor sp.]|nr:Hexagonal wall protein [uncultured Flavonifractor sp.]